MNYTESLQAILGDESSVSGDESSSLKQLFPSKTRLKLLRLFLSHPEEVYYVRELTRIITSQINSVRRELKNLENFGIIFSLKREGDQKKYYLLNASFILYPELKALFFKAQLLLEGHFIKHLQKLRNIQYLVLTGFFVGLEHIPTDILIVGRINRRKFLKILERFEKNLAREINYTIMSPREFKYRKDITDRFLYNILENEKIEVINKLS